MESKFEEMKEVFKTLSEKNQDIIILVTQSIKIAQQTEKENPPSAVRTA